MIAILALNIPYFLFLFIYFLFLKTMINGILITALSSYFFFLFFPFDVIFDISRRDPLKVIQLRSPIESIEVNWIIINSIAFRLHSVIEQQSNFYIFFRVFQLHSILFDYIRLHLINSILFDYFGFFQSPKLRLISSSPTLSPKFFYKRLWKDVPRTRLAHLLWLFKEHYRRVKHTKHSNIKRFKVSM